MLNRPREIVASALVLGAGEIAVLYGGRAIAAAGVASLFVLHVWLREADHRRLALLVRHLKDLLAGKTPSLLPWDNTPDLAQSLKTIAQQMARQTRRERDLSHHSGHYVERLQSDLSTLRRRLAQARTSAAVDLYQVVRNRLMQHQVQARSHVAVALHVGRERPAVTCDAEILQQVLDALLRQALHNSAIAGCPLVVRLGLMAGSMAKVVIEDGHASRSGDNAELLPALRDLLRQQGADLTTEHQREEGNILTLLLPTARAQSSLPAR